MPARAHFSSSLVGRFPKHLSPVIDGYLDPSYLQRNVSEDRICNVDLRYCSDIMEVVNNFSLLGTVLMDVNLSGQKGIDDILITHIGINLGNRVVHLNISGCSLYAESCGDLIRSLCSLSCLQYLNIADNPDAIDDTAVTTLISSMKSLQNLDISGNIRVTDI